MSKMRCSRKIAPVIESVEKGRINIGRKKKHTSQFMELKELKEATKKWVRYYNGERLHQALGYRTPDEVYYGGGLVIAS